jgi:Zn-dependent protease
LRLFSLAGIEVRIDRTFWLLPLFFGVWTGIEAGWETGLRMAVLIIGVFLCVLGHEFTHGFRARHLGIEVPFITLYPMGGVAAMARMPRRSWHEFSIAAVGPLFNFALAAAAYYPLLHLLGPETLFHPTVRTWEGTLANLFWINPILGAFNLIPAFPMDGGRMLRALLSARLKYALSTRIAVNLGRFFAIIFFLLGIKDGQWMLVLVGLYVFFAAANELRQVENELS